MQPTYQPSNSNLASEVVDSHMPFTTLPHCGSDIYPTAILLHSIPN